MEFSTEAVDDVTCNYGKLGSVRQQRYTVIGLLLMAYKFYIWNICLLGQQQYLVVLAVIKTLLPKQLRNTLKIQAFGGV